MASNILEELRKEPGAKTSTFRGSTSRPRSADCASRPASAA